MRKHFDKPIISTGLKHLIVKQYVIDFLKTICWKTSQINWIIYINKHKTIADEDNNDSTRDISIYDFMKWLNKKTFNH